MTNSSFNRIWQIVQQQATRLFRDASLNWIMINSLAVNENLKKNRLLCNSSHTSNNATIKLISHENRLQLHNE